jgi:catechol 2,3-dioxygenase-like lactoylglutathione lyase family enzyme
MTTSSQPTAITGLHTVGVPVSDQPRALDFYVGKLGFEKRLDAPFGERRWLEVAPRGAATSIALVAATGAPIGVDTGIRLSSTDAEADHAALLAEGVEVDAEIMRLGDFVPPMFALRDPDGNRLVIVQQGSPPSDDRR